MPMQYPTKPAIGSSLLSREDSSSNLPNGSSFHEDMSAGYGVNSKEPLLKKSQGFSITKSGMKVVSNGSHVSRKRVQNRRQLMEVLVTMQKSYNQEFLMVVNTIVNKSNVPVRPPHNPDNFPCDFNDCLYCVLKQVFNESLRNLETSILRDVQELKTLHI